MAKVSDKIWLEIQTLYETGTGLCELERQFKVLKQTIAYRAKKGNWIFDKFSQQKIEIANASSVLEKNFDKILDSATPSELKILKPQLDEVQSMVKNIFNLAKGGMTLQNQILRKTIQSHNSGDIEGLKASHIASQIANSLGLSTSNIAKMAGIDTMENNNSNNNQNNVVIPDDPIEAARIYHEFINGGK